MLVLPREVSMGVPDASSVWCAGSWWTATVVRPLCAVEKSAEVVVPAGVGLVAGKDRT